MEALLFAPIRMTTVLIASKQDTLMAVAHCGKENPHRDSQRFRLATKGAQGWSEVWVGLRAVTGGTLACAPPVITFRWRSPGEEIRDPRQWGPLIMVPTPAESPKTFISYAREDAERPGREDLLHLREGYWLIAPRPRDRQDLQIP